ncbi:MAG: bifunctional diaminohydroxyphosphoribosylaminopyrimidine deaminase/5-amino-6-(5-phosphoribosylamino)uracil reductase RibD [Deltaproteobacteria bacterium]|nr:bifunctional diaminohydroxyphosphoribosylaminopyrimidine deaminase/5-amino-6-(5-phosphoribosylamino)uracil reductase RibD [Deltaproteobacteria bacterium]
MINKDEKMMREALRLAKKGMGRTSPNPAVGAVVVREGKIIASGYHKRAGFNHAEVEALLKMPGRAREDDVLYVTLEPCHHHGRTPPCTQAILKKGLKKVVVGMRDPNPGVTGGGCEFLAKRGVEVRSGVLESECRKLNESYIKFVLTGRPYVVAKSAMTLDGWVATSSGHSQWVTNEMSRQFVHQLRDRMDGVMVGVGTVLTDDPLLTTRLKRGRGRDPVRIIVDTHLRTPDRAKVLNSESSSETLMIVGPDVPAQRLRRIEREGVSILTCPTKQGRIDLGVLLDLLGSRDMTSILVEGGSAIMGSLISERLIDKFFIFKAPKILGGHDGMPMASGFGPEKMDAALRLNDIKVRRFGDDVLIEGYVEK